MSERTFVGATVLLPDDRVETTVKVVDGVIAEVGGPISGEVIDVGGKFLAPAIVDVHGDAFERQLMPRPGVDVPLDIAILEADKQLAANGITTAYHALTLGWEPGLRSVDRGREFIAALTRLLPRLTVENRVQLRWETFAFEAIDLIEGALVGPLTPAIAFNDHTSSTMLHDDVPVQERPFDIMNGFPVIEASSPRFAKVLARHSERTGLTPAEYGRQLMERWESRGEVAGAIQTVAAKGRSAGAPMLSHDDTQEETRAFYRAVGARVAEFPMRKVVAEAAREGGDAIIFGAPNAARGGSHLGSPSAADMVEDGLCDALASDYYYPALLAAVDRLQRDRRGDLPALWRLVSSGPAAAMGLHDRGVIEEGKRADLVVLDWPQGSVPSVTMTLSGGRTAYAAETNG